LVRTVAVVGPTATGKTGLALALARHLGDAELVNADSRQVLRGLRVGINGVDESALDGVACHLTGIAEPGEGFTVADWLVAARRCLDDLDRRERRAIVVGGTGLYVTALLDGFDLAGVPPHPQNRSARNALATTTSGLTALAEEVRRRDPEGHARLDLRNPRRLVRALEVLDARGPLPGPERGRGREADWIGIDAPPDLYRQLVVDRTRRMLSGGLLEETAAALRRGVSRDALAAAGIGYTESLAVLDGEMSDAVAADEIVRRTLRYAKARRTWFRRERRIRWVEHPGTADVAALLKPALNLLT
jgi:tRNA dimethylallyltransferase